MHIPTIIIGAGPAGISAAIQLRRAGANFLLIEKEIVGGLLLNANLVENYPGFSGGISGPELVEKFQTQLQALDINITKDHVRLVDHHDKIFIVRTSNSEYTCDNVIVASGTKPKELKTSSKVHYEIHELRDVKNKNITIIGGGDAAFDYALNLARHNNVNLLCRSKPKCLPLLHERVLKTPSIKIFLDADIEYHLTNNTTDHIILAIGRNPNNDFLSPMIKNHHIEKNNVRGLYFAGDVARGNHRQTAIAVGDGMRAAMDIIMTTNHPSTGSG